MICLLAVVIKLPVLFLCFFFFYILIESITVSLCFISYSYQCWYICTECICNIICCRKILNVLWLFSCKTRLKLFTLFKFTLTATRKISPTSKPSKQTIIFWLLFKNSINRQDSGPKVLDYRFVTVIYSIAQWLSLHWQFKVDIVWNFCLV